VREREQQFHSVRDRLPPFPAAVTPQSTWQVNRSLVGLQLMNALILGAILGFPVDFMNEAGKATGHSR